MAKEYLDINVYEMAKKRFEYLFSEFDNILVAFSGSKDSSVCLEMAYEYAKNNNMLDKLAMYHLDYEAQYQMTTDFVDEQFKRFSDIKRFWLCLPVKAQCCCSVDTGYWVPWEKEKEKIWVREMPKYEYVINEDNCPSEIDCHDFDYDVQDMFGKYFAKTYGKTAVVIGLRSEESLNRFRAISSKRNLKKYKDQNYINGYLDDEDDIVYKAYPIYDWLVDDIWIFNSKFEKEYNKLYDLYYQAGMSVDQMRVASPFNDAAAPTLRFYRVIDPNNWGKMVGRINGVNFTSIYGGTTAMGWRQITKPSHFTWKEYCFFLLNTLDDKTREHYLEKLNTSIKFWKEVGGGLSPEIIKDLEDRHVKFNNRGPVSKLTTKDIVTFDDYLDEIDIKDFKSIPSYKRMCICIMKNDYYCKYMGFSQTKKEQALRERALDTFNKVKGE